MKKSHLLIILPPVLSVVLVFLWLNLLNLHPVLAAQPYAPTIGEEINVLDGSTDIPNGTGLVDFGSTPVGSSITKTFTISNSGFGSLTLFEPLSVPAGFSVIEGFAGLTETVLAGEATTFTVQLDAAASGSYSGTLSFLNSDADESPYQFTIQGVVLGPEIATLENGVLVPNGTGLVDFGSTPLYSPIAKTFTISNSGSITLTLTTPISVPTGFSVPDSFGRTAVPANETTTFTVQLDAAALGSYSGTLSFINSDADESPYQFTIQGEVGAPEIAVLENGTLVPHGTGQVDFGSTPLYSPITKTFTISNSGSITLTLTTPISVPIGFSVPDSFGRTAVPASETTTFTVQLDAAALGSYSGTLSFINSDADESPYQFTIQGEVGAPEIAVLENGTLVPDGTGQVDFGSTPLYNPIVKTFTISNSGSFTLTLTAPISVPTGFSVPDSFGRTAVPAGETTTFTVQLDAAAPGSYSGTLEFANDDADENPYTFTISGTVTAPDLGISKSVTPAEALPGETITYILAFSNTGNGMATGVVITDSIPISVTHSSLSYTYAGAAITATGTISYVWHVEDLSPGEWGIITVTGQISDPLEAGSLTNTAEIDTDVAEDNTTNNTASVGMTVIPPFAWVNGVYYVTLQDAIDAANPGGEVRVVGGEAIPEVEPVAGLTQTGYITKNLTIRGGYSRANGFAGPADPANPAWIDAGGNGRALVVTGTVEVALVNLRLTGGDATAGGRFSNRGGGLAIQGATVTLDNSAIVNNTAPGGGGGVYLGSVLIVTNGSVISGNITANSGGGIYVSGSSTVTLDAASVITNTAAVDGGGIYNNGGALILRNGAHVDDNHADDDGGGVYNTGGGRVDVTGATTTIGQDGLGNTANDKGGGVCTVGSGSTLTVQDGAHVEGNVADHDHSSGGDGGGIYNASSGVVTVDDAIVGNNSGDRGGGIYNNATLTVQNGALVSYNSGDQGGGIYNSATLIVQNGARVGDNVAHSSGGGIYNSANQVTVDASTVADNRATAQGGGGIYHRTGVLNVQNGSSVEGNTAAGGSNGGGIYVSGDSEVRVSHSAVISNTAADGGDGGAFYNCGDLHLANVTVSGNEADDQGGGIYNFVSSHTGTTTLQLATVAFNTASDGGGIYRFNGLVTISNTIVANNSGAVPDCGGRSSTPGDYVVSGDYNLIGDPTGCRFTPAAHDITGTGALLGPLQDNGGGSLTHALLVGSPALEQIPEGVNGCGTVYTTDQRGLPRPGTANDQTNKKCEIGAWEAQATDPTAVTLRRFAARTTTLSPLGWEIGLILVVVYVGLISTILSRCGLLSS